MVHAGELARFRLEGRSVYCAADYAKRQIAAHRILDSDAIHLPNEHFGLDRFAQGIDAVIRFHAAYAARMTPSQ